MFLSGTLSVDPSFITKIEKVQPEKAFKKLLFKLTGGKVADVIERETFTAISILQSFNKVFNSIGITNIVRISQDNIDFYFDDKGVDNDLQYAFDKYSIQMDSDVSAYFNTIYLVLEYKPEFSSFNYLIELRINRTHAVSKFPIEIKINGLLEEFKLRENESKAELEERLKENVFNSQESYDDFVNDKKIEFADFIGCLEQKIKMYIPAENIHVSHDAKVVIPKMPINDVNDYTPNNMAGEPAYHGYAGMGNIFFYSLLWSSMMHSNSIFAHDVSFISDNATDIGSIGESGIDTGTSPVFDDSLDYNDRINMDDSSFDSSSNFADSSDSTGDSGSWFSDGGSSDFGDSGGGGCSSCGGGD